MVVASGASHHAVATELHVPKQSFAQDQCSVVVLDEITEVTRLGHRDLRQRFKGWYFCSVLCVAIGAGGKEPNKQQRQENRVKGDSTDVSQG